MLIPLAAPLLVLAAGLAAEPSESAFTLRGMVLDPSRAPIEGAQVTATPDRGAPSATLTDASGDFALPLAPGRYTVEVVAAGFRPASQSVSAGPTGAESREFVLKVHSFQETVTVNAVPG